MAKSANKKAKRRGQRKASVKRVRTDTFSSYRPEENAQFFNGIATGDSESYAMNFSASVKQDYNGNERHCWRVYSKANPGKWVNSLRSVKAYRLAVLWSVHYPDFWKPKRRDEKVQSIQNDLPTIHGKRGAHSRHRCGNDWCCNPGHIQIGSRVANEIDKHFHWFLNHEDEDVRQRFRKAMQRQCREHRLF